MTAPSVLKWHGGKSWLAPKFWDLVGNIKDWKPRHVVETHFGGGSFIIEGLRQRKNLSFVANDIDGRLSNFWRVLADPKLFEEFHRIIEATPFSREVWQSALRDADIDCGPIKNATNFFVMIRQSMSGRGDQFTGITRERVRRGMNETVSAWLRSVDGLPEVHSLLRKVLILNRNADEVIRKEDAARTLFYVDPPYLFETRATTGEYKFEMTKKQHIRLLTTLSGIQGRFFLSGYRSKLYDNFSEEFGWSRVDFELANNSAAGKKKQRRTECVWSNSKFVGV